ncbi:MAG: hypothetical protein PHW46_00775, partial [Candidatus Omnitrophica bacterium]|nr:hypothetical protein [Candidatus Omnitrophota bacterium]
LPIYYYKARNAAYEAQYREIFEAVAQAGTEKLSHYQATSIRLSRAIEAMPTAAAYLREFSRTIEDKKARDIIRKKLKEKEEMEQKRLTLFNQTQVPDQKEAPRRYLTYVVPALVLESKTQKALETLFASEAFQGKEENIDVYVYIMNTLLNVYVTNVQRQSEAGVIDSVVDEKTKKQMKGNIERFILGFHQVVEEMSNTGEHFNTLVQEMEVIGGQALNIISWVDRGVPGASAMRLTAEERNMVKSSKGKSFIDRATLPTGAGEVTKEGACGFFWRGLEGIKKLGPNIKEYLIFNKEVFAHIQDKIAMYIMDHGFISVPDGIKGITENGTVSTMHETTFIKDYVPGSLQTTSTGAGHFQGLSLDIKQVTEGRGIQFNVLYSEDGRQIIGIIAQELNPGDVCFALPGYVDYVVNLGGLRFNDFSIKLTAEQANRINPLWDFTTDKTIKPTSSPYIGATINGKPQIIKSREKVPDAVWVSVSGRKGFDGILGQKSDLISLYNGLTNEQMPTLVDLCSQLLNRTQGEETPGGIALRKEEEIPTDAAAHEEKKFLKEISGSFEKTKYIKTYIEDNAVFFGGIANAPVTVENAKRIRISTGELKQLGKEKAAGFLQALQSVGNLYIELYSSGQSVVSENSYQDYGITKKTLPQGFTSDRSNTITIFPVDKGYKLSETEAPNKQWEVLGDMKDTPDKTILVPAGRSFDRSGFARSVFLGLRLSEIAKNRSEADSAFVAYTLKQYMNLCFSLGQDPESFDITGTDITNLATGNKIDMIRALNKIVKALPLMPINYVETKEVYDIGEKLVQNA